MDQPSSNGAYDRNASSFAHTSPSSERRFRPDALPSEYEGAPANPLPLPDSLKGDGDHTQNQ
jgi:hypothetical protein